MNDEALSDGFHEVPTYEMDPDFEFGERRHRDGERCDCSCECVESWEEDDFYFPESVLIRETI